VCAVIIAMLVLVGLDSLIPVKSGRLVDLAPKTCVRTCEVEGSKRKEGD
jgi:hypothetical protein